MRTMLLGCAVLVSLCCFSALRAEDLASAQQSPTGEASSTDLPMAELENLTARIALFPDPLIAQILPASTYPLEIVQAARYLKEKQSLAKSKPEEFQKEVGKQKWDASVKVVAMCPDALTLLNGDLDWTTQLGEAFLAQPDDLMSAIQTMRAKAQANGVLKDSPQQTVIVEKEVIRILPSDPEIIYVPQYNPKVVYVQQPATTTIVVDDDDDTATAVAAGVIGFGAGLLLGAALANDCDWHGGHVYHHGYPHYGYAQAGHVSHYNNTTINRNVNKTNTINNANIQNKYGSFNGQKVTGPRNPATVGGAGGVGGVGGAGGAGGKWQHSPEHRKGQGFQNPKAKQAAGGSRLQSPKSSGWGSSRPSASQQPAKGSSSGMGSSRPSASTRPAGGSSSSRASSTRPSSSSGSAFSGAGSSGSSTRQQSSRGNQSLSRSSGSGRSSGASRSSGGSSRSGSRSGSRR